jgi:uncharacterized LabA/DUF88 family protein
MPKESNLAYIDGQNLHLGTLQNGWRVDHGKFRVYLKDKYRVDEAYYFLGYVTDEQQGLYKNLQKSGFIVLFREHSVNLKANKKGNVDTDIVFEVMKSLTERDDFNKVILVSGDGDYKKLVDYLAQKHRLKKLLFPNRQYASSLYKNLAPASFDHLDTATLQAKIGYSQKKRSP